LKSAWSGFISQVLYTRELLALASTKRFNERSNAEHLLHL